MVFSPASVLFSVQLLVAASCYDSALCWNDLSPLLPYFCPQCPWTADIVPPPSCDSASWIDRILILGPSLTVFRSISRNHSKWHAKWISGSQAGGQKGRGDKEAQNVGMRGAFFLFCPNINCRNSQDCEEVKCNHFPCFTATSCGEVIRNDALDFKMCKFLLLHQRSNHQRLIKSFGKHCHVTPQD